MRTEHRVTIVAHCPEEPGLMDKYELTVITDRLIKVEDILEAVEDHTQRPIYQEALTQTLADELAATVITEGEHKGVRTRCEAMRSYELK